MAVPKKKKSASAGRRQEMQWRLMQQNKIMRMVDRELRHEKGRKILAEEAANNTAHNPNITVVAA